MVAMFVNPHAFMRASRPLAPLFTAVGVALIVWGAWMGLFVAPAEARQGDAARIMFVHVPAAWMCMLVYVFMAGASLISLVYRHVMADMAARAAAPIGAAFTALCLVTGSIWAKPIWGTWWEWDARMTSVLILFFLYLGYIAIWNAMDTPQKAGRAAAILCLVGVVVLPVIKFSVEWFYTLHQTATFFTGKLSTTFDFKFPMYIVALGYLSFWGGTTLLGIRAEVLNRRADLLALRRAGRDEG